MTLGKDSRANALVLHLLCRLLGHPVKLGATEMDRISNSHPYYVLLAVSLQLQAEYAPLLIYTPCTDGEHRHLTPGPRLQGLRSVPRALGPRERALDLVASITQMFTASLTSTLRMR